MDKNQDNESLESRRSFIKKAAYAAPTIIALGAIRQPVSAAASVGITVNQNLGGQTTDSVYADKDQADSDYSEGEANSPFN